MALNALLAPEPPLEVSAVAGRLARLENLIHGIYELAPFGSHCAGADGTYQHINALELAWLGCAAQDLIGKKGLIDFLTPQSQLSFGHMLQQTGVHGFADLELDLLNSNGVVRPVRLSASSTDHVAEGLQTQRFVLFDITMLKQAREKQRIAAVAFESLTGIVVTDVQGTILQVNRAFTTLTGYTADEVHGKNMHLLSSGHHEKAFFERMWNAINTGGSWQGEIYNRRKDGTIITEWLSISAAGFQEGKVSNYIGSFLDITESKASQAEIKRLAFFDPLTQLPNRRLLQDRLDHALSMSARSRLFGALLYLDLDNFKILNDTRGHAAGDLLLIQVAKRLRSAVREGDTVARLGGDEFVVLLDGLAQDDLESARQARHTGEKILAEMARPYQFSEFEFHCSASLGISMYRDESSSADLLKQSDLAMYQAKKAGRNTLRFFNPNMQEAVSLRFVLEQDLSRAVKEKQFELYFQAQVNHLGQITGAEGLLRWKHPLHGHVSPADFIPLAENTGAIVPLGLWVLETACAQLKAWQSNPLTKHLKLAVNVSARQLEQDDFVEQVARMVKSSAIDTSRLKLEITESMVVNIESAIAKMDALRAMGVRFSMDDFGTGFSSLSSLSRLPLHQIKIDQSFVQKMVTSVRDEMLVKTIIGMAHTLGLKVIAEGVETKEQRDLLETHGCLMYQGYFFSRPVPLEAFQAILT